MTILLEKRLDEVEVGLHIGRGRNALLVGLGHGGVGVRIGGGSTWWCCAQRKVRPRKSSSGRNLETLVAGATSETPVQAVEIPHHRVARHQASASQQSAHPRGTFTARHPKVRAQSSGSFQHSRPSCRNRLRLSRSRPLPHTQPDTRSFELTPHV